jgi:hypothetical protein
MDAQEGVMAGNEAGGGPGVAWAALVAAAVGCSWVGDGGRDLVRVGEGKGDGDAVPALSVLEDGAAVSNLAVYAIGAQLARVLAQEEADAAVLTGVEIPIQIVCTDRCTEGAPCLRCDDLASHALRLGLAGSAKSDVFDCVDRILDHFDSIVITVACGYGGGIAGSLTAAPGPGSALGFAGGVLLCGYLAFGHDFVVDCVR